MGKEGFERVKPLGRGKGYQSGILIEEFYQIRGNTSI